MATNPPHPPNDPTSPSPADSHFDELTGVYGFFRRHQKKLLYTAGLFTLLTFSITGPMMDTMRTLFGTQAPLPSIAVGGKRIELQPSDYQFGTLMANNISGFGEPRAIPMGVLPPLDAGEGGRSELGDVLAILRRAAIAEGIEVSMREVDRAIEVLREAASATSPARLASNMGFASLAQYRELLAEAMRVGTYVRLQTLALDTTEAKVLAQVASDREKLTLRVATLDEKQLEEQLKAAPPDEAALRAWFDGKNDREKMMMQAFDLPRAELRFGALLLAEDQFDPQQWEDEFLAGFTVGDDQLKGYYEQDKELRFKLPDGEFKPFDDEAVKAELTRVVQAEQVMNQLLAKLREKVTDSLQAANEALATAQQELSLAGQAAIEAQRQLGEKSAALASKEAEAAQRPDDASLAAEVQTLRAEVEALTADSAAKQEQSTQAQAAATAASEALQAKRAQFDFPAAFAELTAGKRGFVQRAMRGRQNADELKDLDAAGLELGVWPLAAQGTRLGSKGDLGFGPGRTSKAVLLYQATDVEPRPLKPWEQLKPLAEGAYFTEQAKADAQTKQAAMEAALLRLAKERMPEQIAELEAGRQQRIDARLAEWEKRTSDGLAEAAAVLARPGLGSQATTAWQRKRDTLTAELALREQRLTEFAAEVQKEIDEELAVAAKQHYHAVLDAAAAEAGFTVTKVGPHARDLQREPRFDKAYDPTVVYLFRNHSALKENEATSMLQDFANRRWHVAVGIKVEPLTPADVTRRDFESLRTGDGNLSFASQQAFRAYQQAFTRKAVETRYALQRETGVQQVPPPKD